MERRNNSGGSSPAFFIGIIIGVLVTLLLSTKKGRKILKVLVDEGVERVSKWEDIVDSLKTQVEEDIELEQEPIMGEEVVQIEETKEPEGAEGTVAKIETQEEAKEEPPLHAAVAEKKESKDPEVEVKPKKKSRFFKRSPKKSA